MKPGRNDPCICGSGKKYKHCCLGKGESRPATTVDASRLVELFNSGCYAELERRTRLLAEQYPDSGLNWKLLGASLQMQGKGALPALQKAAQLLPEDAEAHSNLGAALQEQGRLAEAEASLRHALEITPAFAAAHSNLGNVLKDRGRLDGAVASYRRALECKPDFAEVHANLGAALLELGSPAEAEASLRRALELSPGLIEALNSLAILLAAKGEPAMALRLVETSLHGKETAEAKAIFVDCVKRLQFTQVSGAFRDDMARALSEPWGRPGELAQIGAALVKLNPAIGACVARAVAAWPQRLPAQDLFGSSALAAVSGDALLHVLLDAAPVCDIELERFLTLARHTLLHAAGGAADAGDGVALCFYAALARQCFINEYVFACDDDEAALARALRDSLRAALDTDAPVPALWPVAVAAYFPLHALPRAGRLLDRPWPEAVSAVLAQQIREPEEERPCRATLPRLAAVEDEVSLRVQHQYEENPYPRWIKAAPAGKPQTIDGFLRQRFPLADFRPLGKGSGIDILIAGCGTGQQSIETARKFPGARMLAVDLSLASLCYAARKTRELGLSMIEYAQADILKLGSLDRRFDLIESSGVLHHLADPLAGWRVLLSLLRPGGFMRLGFYSELARRDVVRARALIAEQGYGQTAEDIRQCRQQLLNFDAGAGFGALVKLGDFFSISACRDLLFHVQEQRMTLAGIEAFLRDNALQFLGFQLEAPVREAYRRRFPDDLAATNLGHWQVFERENPDTFIGMYQFWVQKAG